MKENMKEYNYRVYLAGPFFNEEQIDRINFIEDTLDLAGFDVFSPRQASLIKPGSTQSDMIRTFNGNISHIDSCDFMLAIVDGNDTGTVFETGYAYSKNKPILFYNETREKGPNLMLAMSGGLPFITKTTTLEELIEDVPEGLKNESRPRSNLITILTRIQAEGLDAIIDKTVSQFDEVE